MPPAGCALVEAGLGKERVEELGVFLQGRQLGGCIQILFIAERLSLEFAHADEILLPVPGEGHQIDFCFRRAQMLRRVGVADGGFPNQRPIF